MRHYVPTATGSDAAGEKTRGVGARRDRRDGVTGLVLVVLGAAVVAVPDSGGRLVSLSEQHGPSAVDALGLAVFFAGYAVLARLVWRRRGALSRGRVLRALAVVVAGAALLVPAIAYDVGALWAVAVGVMALPQAYLLRRAFPPAPAASLTR